MSSLVIVAIPEEQDYVHKISSEKVPHLTMLYLGDVEGKPVDRIMEFLGHAVNILEFGPFGLEVDRRSVLGENQADVLYFNTKSWSMKRLKEFRGQLLKNNDIRKAYESSDQFDPYPDGWTPHLTLGYPETPAKEDKRDYPGFHWVEFNRIALWYGDYQGPEFRLEYNYDFAEVAMSSTADRGRDFLEHFGVKGMKWGQRKAAASVSATSRTSGVTRKTKVKTSGGEAHPAHPDALKAATAKQKLKKSGPAALGNTELRDLANRLQLEQQVSQLAGSKGGRKFVKDTLATTGKQQVARVVNEGATRGVNQHVLRK